MADATGIRYYLQVVTGGTEIDLEGPYASEDERLDAAIKIRGGADPEIPFNPETDGLFWLDVDVRLPADPAVCGEFSASALTPEDPVDNEPFVAS